MRVIYCWRCGSRRLVDRNSCQSCGDTRKGWKEEYGVKEVQGIPSDEEVKRNVKKILKMFKDNDIESINLKSDKKQ